MAIREPPRGCTEREKIEWYRNSAEKLADMVIRLQRRVDELEERYENKPRKYRYY